MNKELKKYFNHLGQSIMFWTIAMFLWGLFRFYGLMEMEGVSVNNSLFREAMQIKYILRLFTFSGIVIGLVFANIEFFFEKYTSNKITLGLKPL